MNIHDNYEKKLEYISMFNGVCLNIEEKLKLEIAFNELHNKIKCEEIWFWGKIFGSESDYYFALGINFKDHYEFPEKKFYFCTSANFNFEQLPSTFEYHDKDFVKSYSPNNPITGNPAIIIERYVKDEDNPDADNLANNNENNENNNPGDNNNPDASSNFNPNDPDESVDLTPKTEIKKENFTELLKISYIVRNIDFDTNVFPQGALRLIPIHELRRNESFTGLKPEELRDLSKFHHFRPIRLPKNK
jgi:hypothetical protein